MRMGEGGDGSMMLSSFPPMLRSAKAVVRLCLLSPEGGMEGSGNRWL